MKNFKWYRKLCGGMWYQNRYIYDMGRVVLFKWERNKGTSSGGSNYNIKIENYEK